MFYLKRVTDVDAKVNLYNEYNHTEKETEKDKSAQRDANTARWLQ